MSDREYNGWTNYETWLVNLWLSNDSGSEEMLRETVGGCRTKYDAGRAIRAMVDEMADEWMPDQASMFADMIGAALKEVDWQKIASHYMPEEEEEIEEEAA